MSKSKYDTHVLPRLQEVEAWARNGVAEKDIAHNLGVAYSTFREYKGLYPALAAVLTRTRVYVDDVVVVGAYLRRVVGYDALETRREYVMVPREDGTTERVLVKEIEQTRHIPPDPRAAEFWLTNRQPDKWRHKPEPVSDDGEDEGTGVVELPAVMARPEPPGMGAEVDGDGR